jgi:hypothetical protein
MRTRPTVLLMLITMFACDAGAGTVENWIRSFSESEIEFQRSTGNAPFVPLAFVDISLYGEMELKRPDDTSLRFRQTTISQAAGLPLLVTERDMVVLGEYIAWSSFESRTSDFEDFEVLSVGLPVGWLRQVNPAWQAAAFVMPLGHKATLDNSRWSWEVMGGVFGRYVENDQRWWAIGFFADVGIGDDLYLPYAGVSWELSDELTISAVMPWPSILYAPDRDRLYRLGASPSGASWGLFPGQGEITFELGSWDFGIAAEQRLQGNLWGSIEAGIGGLRSLRVSGGSWQRPEFDIGASPYISIGINFRPSLQ